ncbi:MAG: retention module-containing protein, partial [Pseudomonas sp.]|nr:retention module-containing protein [Pseudomonas sp.]
MSNFVAVIKSLVGQVFVVSLDGLKRQVFEGERLFQGDQIVTASGGSAVLELANGDVIDIAANGNWQAAGGQAPDQAATPQQPASDLEQAIAAGFDPTADLEAPAAGPGAGGSGGAAGGGHSFVMLDETGQQLDPTVGFDTEGLGFAGQRIEETGGANTNETTTVLVDTTAPVVTISIDAITADNTLNAAELLGDFITVTGSVGGEANIGDNITLNVGGSLYDGVVIARPDGTPGFSINVGTGDLRDVSSITATLTSVDQAGNTGTASSLRDYSFDTSAPTLTISVADGNLAAGESTLATFQFSEAVSGFDATDMTVEGGTLSNFTQVNAETWTATFIQSGSDTPSITVADNSYTDLAGNNGSGDDLTLAVDLTAPTLTISVADGNLAAGESTLATFQFSEAVSGFDATDVTVEGGTLSNFTQDDAETWTATFTQTGNDTPSITVADNSYTDLAGNNGTGDDLTLAVDINAPTVTTGQSFDYAENQTAGATVATVV